MIKISQDILIRQGEFLGNFEASGRWNGLVPDCGKFLSAAMWPWMDRCHWLTGMELRGSDAEKWMLHGQGAREE